MKKSLTEKEWRAMGDQAKQAREQLFKLHSLSSGTMPKDILTQLTKSIAYLDKYRSKAESRMIDTGTASDLTIFYGKGETLSN